MPRTDDLKTVQTAWASAPAANKNLDPRPGEPALVVANGFPAAYSQTDGSKATREQLNQHFYWSTEHIRLWNQHGVAEWDAVVMYQHPALVFGANGILYISEQDSTNENPTTDSAGTYWQAVAPDSRLLPANNGPADSYLNGNKTWGSLATDVARVLADRLVPSGGTADQVLHGNNTWATPPSTTTRTELWFGNESLSTGSSSRFRTLGPSTDYNVGNYDLIEVYIQHVGGQGSIPNHERLRRVAIAHVGLIPPNNLASDTGGTTTPGRVDTTPGGMWLAFPMGHIQIPSASNPDQVEIAIWKYNGRLVAYLQRHENIGSSISLHWSIYGTKY